MATQPARELTARQQSALPGTGYHKVVRTAKWLRPTLAGVVGVAMLAWPVMGGHDFSFVLAKDRVAIASERLKIPPAPHPAPARPRPPPPTSPRPPPHPPRPLAPPGNHPPLPPTPPPPPPHPTTPQPPPPHPPPPPPT